jgi:hypothetical protein
VAIGGSCFSYRTDYQAGQTTLEERDAATLQLLRTYAPLHGTPSAIFPSLNLVASSSSVFLRVAGPLDVRALDVSRPIGISWLARLQTACDMFRVADDRALTLFGPPSCSGDTGWHGELVEVSTGRIVRALAPGQTISGGTREYAVLADSGVAVDPRDGSDGLALAGGDPLAVDWDRGIAAAPLSDGGAYVLQRQAGTPAPRVLRFRTVAAASCGEYEFPRVMNAAASSVTCAAVAQQAGATRLLIATGRSAYGPVTFDVTRVIADPVAHTLDVVYRGAGRRTTINDPSPTKIIELADPPSGEWLVRLVGEDAALSSAKAFVVRFS